MRKDENLDERALKQYGSRKSKVLGIQYEGIKPSMNDYIHIYTYTFQEKMGTRTHECYEPYLIIGQLVNGRSWAIQDQILLVQIQTKEEWILLTEFLFTLLYFD